MVVGNRFETSLFPSLPHSTWSTSRQIWLVNQWELREHSTEVSFSYWWVDILMLTWFEDCERWGSMRREEKNRKWKSSQQSLIKIQINQRRASTLRSDFEPKRPCGCCSRLVWFFLSQFGASLDYIHSSSFVLDSAWYFEFAQIFRWSESLCIVLAEATNSSRQSIFGLLESLAPEKHSLSTFLLRIWSFDCFILI